ncbi:MAG TPA: hypothetical protein VH062_24610 [Polyangiaceae bacterium]|jgi:hypothetical protein|nr:hypothetical protein [Polyangiaceae bacterium]
MGSPLARSRALVVAALIAASFTTVAHAGSSDECIAAHTEGQQLRREGKLLAARDRFLACVADPCPAIIRKDCSAFDDDVEAHVPTVVFALTDAGGKDVHDATVTIDDGAEQKPLDGRDVALDPGSHRFTFTTPSGETASMTVVLREGEKLRRVVAALPPVAKPAVASSRYLPVPTLAYVLGGVGVAALGSFTYFAISGKAKQDDLEAHCAPHCTESAVDTMRTRYLIADISLAVSVVSLGVGTYVFFADPFGERTAQKAADSATFLHWAVSGAPGLATATVSGRF